MKKAYIRFKNIDGIEKVKYEKFCKDERSWLEDYALFSAVKDSFNGKPWFDWEKDIKFRKKEAVEKYKKELCDDIEFHKFMQYEFFKQWIELKNYANMNGIKIICDIPLYIAHDSADVWANPEIFEPYHVQFYQPTPALFQTYRRIHPENQHGRTGQSRLVAGGNGFV